MKEGPARPAHKLFIVANFITFKEKPSNVDLFYCLSNIISTRNMLVVVVVMIMTITTIITCLPELVAINITGGAAFFPGFFFSC